MARNNGKGEYLTINLVYFITDTARFAECHRGSKYPPIRPPHLPINLGHYFKVPHACDDGVSLLPTRLFVFTRNFLTEQRAKGGTMDWFAAHWPTAWY